MRLIDADLERSRIGVILKEQGEGAYSKIFSADDILKLLNNAPTFLQGKVTESDYSYEKVTFIKPIEHHYEENGERPYIKYGCPVCEALGNKHQVTYNTEKCDLCGVNLLWECNEICREDVAKCENWDTDKCKLHR